MKYPASETLEIIRLVEQSHLPVRRQSLTLIVLPEMLRDHLNGIIQMSDLESHVQPKPDTRAMMAFEASKKSIALAYVLWACLGLAGVHRFYLGNTASGAAMLALFIVGWFTFVFVVGIVVLIILAIWWLVDAFLIPHLTNTKNIQLAVMFGV